MSTYPPGELQSAAHATPDAMARIEIQNVAAFQAAKGNPSAYRGMVLLEEIGMRAFQELTTPKDECEHGRLLTDDCADCGRW